jgi:hypothetical protein
MTSGVFCKYLNSLEKRREVVFAFFIMGGWGGYLSEQSDEESVLVIASM